MSLNVKNAPMSGSKFKTEPLTPASYPARLVQAVELGLQPQSYNGEEKQPMYEGYFTFEFSDEFMKDEDGQDIPDKPRWLSIRFPIHNLKAEKAKSTAFYKALDPAEKADGDFFALLGNPALVTVINNPGKGKNAGKVFDNIAGLTAMRPKDAEKLPPLVNKPVAFSLDSPDLEVFKKLPSFIQAVITSNLEFAGSKLEVLMKEAGEATPPKNQSVKAESNDEDGRPY